MGVTLNGPEACLLALFEVLERRAVVPFEMERTGVVMPSNLYLESEWSSRKTCTHRPPRSSTIPLGLRTPTALFAFSLPTAGEADMLATAFACCSR